MKNNQATAAQRLREKAKEWGIPSDLRTGAMEIRQAEAYDAAGKVGSQSVAHKDLSGEVYTPNATPNNIGGSINAVNTAIDFNKNPAQSRGGVASHTAAGALAGAQFGGYGAAIGGATGLTVGLLQAGAAKKAREIELENEKRKMLSAIEQNRNTNIQNAISGMAERLSSALSTPTIRF